MMRNRRYRALPSRPLSGVQQPLGGHFPASDLAFLKIAEALFVGFRAQLTPPWAPAGRASPIHERSTREHGEAMVAGIGTRVHRVLDCAVTRHRVDAEDALVKTTAEMKHAELDRIDLDAQPVRLGRGSAPFPEQL